MKHILTALFLILAASQANAGGFYQMVVGDRPAWGAGTPLHITEFTPLYDRVTAASRKLADDEVARIVKYWSYTPLYRVVIGTDTGLAQHNQARNREIGDSTGS